MSSSATDGMGGRVIHGGEVIPPSLQISPAGSIADNKESNVPFGALSKSLRFMVAPMLGRFEMKVMAGDGVKNEDSRVREPFLVGRFFPIWQHEHCGCRFSGECGGANGMADRFVHVVRNVLGVACEKPVHGVA